MSSNSRVILYHVTDSNNFDRINTHTTIDVSLTIFKFIHGSGRHSRITASIRKLIKRKREKIYFDEHKEHIEHIPVFVHSQIEREFKDFLTLL